MVVRGRKALALFVKGSTEPEGHIETPKHTHRVTERYFTIVHGLMGELEAMLEEHLAEETKAERAPYDRAI